MNDQNIFPEDILKSTVEYHIAKHSKKTNIIFWAIFVTLFSIIIATPFIYVDLYTTSRGQIIPQEKKASLYAPASGRVVLSGLEENKKVQAGDTLLIIDHKIIEEKGRLNNIQTSEYSDYISDLRHLLKRNYNALKTEQYKKEYLKHAQELYNIDVVIKTSQTEFDRADRLYNKQIIAKAEYEKTLLELNKLKNDRVNIIKQAELGWQKQLTDYLQSVTNIHSNSNQLREEEKTYVLIAPISGELLNVQGISKGSTVTPGSVIAEISPDRDIIVETYVSPSDIGYIKEGENVKYQIDAYNSNQWGFATGRIIDIGKDVVFIGDLPVYKIRSSISKKSLYLKNGSEGKLKKGMTLTSRFFLTKRSMFQLLFDEIEDWLNPYNSIKNE
ncbi:HlyD family secretion protein [Flavobacterium cerinum]|uniref:HlyD family secretion protein n=1 Tax=Flavobacterium cerinum TaxID=2502784 RepID=A0ABY5IV52_9FLAO|nr:HlyD family efflux transporter periplasmic adaptor subunit [Flavobacterium cerinum]UUC46175.1 HlyD family secretion protein [Flavobacterium cerinum]